MAFEILIKSVLAKSYNRDQLKKFDHNLPKLWKGLKKISGKDTLDKFDPVIENIHKYESLRYLDFPKGSYWSMSMTVDFGESFKPRVDILKKNKQVYFSFNFDDMDELFKEIIVNASINPPFLKTYFGFKEGLKIYERDNKHNLFTNHNLFRHKLVGIHSQNLEILALKPVIWLKYFQLGV